MRILHTSDFHIGKRLYSCERREEQEAVLKELSDVCRRENIDVVLVAGDLFDNFNPSVASMSLLYDSLCEIADGGKRPVISIAGNHDSPDRIDMPDSFARKNGVFFLGNYDSLQQEIRLNDRITIEKTAQNYMQLRFSDYDYPLQLIVTPFVNEQRLKEKFDFENEESMLRDYLQQVWQQTVKTYATERGVKVLMTHLFVLKDENDTTLEPEDENAINIGGLSAIYADNIPSEIQYTALGHLHRMQRAGKKNVWYSGSPLAYSFSEDEQQKYFLIADIEPEKEPVIKKVSIQSGIAIKNLTAESVEEALKVLSENQDYWVQLRLITDKAISYEQSSQLHSAHGRLLQIIPEIKSESIAGRQRSKILELQDNPVELFGEFYKSTHGGQEPDEALTELFREVMNCKNETR